MTKKHCIHKHEMYFDEMRQAADAVYSDMMYYMAPFKAKNPIKFEKRLKF